MNVVVVESPAKAKTINKYLGSDYRVLASFGHVRDLPPKDGSVRPDEDFAMSWSVSDGSEKHIKEIAQAIAKAERLYLATDPDREGEAISWHIAQELAARKALEGVEVKRVVFNEITKRAVREAFEHPRELNKELIEAYLARRALDYLVGFTLSPVLWRKLPGSKSAGRVQSVALRLVCEREAEIEVFRAQEYWTVKADLLNAAAAPFSARLTHLDGRKLEKFDLPNQAAAGAACAKLRAAQTFEVAKVERKQAKRNPQPPFTTSTLQQEASRKLGFGATRTMRIAQKLYEGVELGGETVGLITYMRTDGVQVAAEAITSTRELIAGRFGDPYLPNAPRMYKTKARNAQEAHEAIRPTDLTRHPRDVAKFVDPDGLKLYDLIWTRMVASQMASAELDQVSVDIAVDGAAAQLRANGSVIRFDGFLALYQEGRDDPKEANGEAAEEGERRLPNLNEGEALTRKAVSAEQHFTQPPPRYSEASLVKKMEELGIGRPSTYASILQVLQDRDYVRLEKRRFIPEDRGRMVTAFLSSFFKRYVEYNFTADLETQLDLVSDGQKNWKQVLQQFWEAFHQAVEETKGLRIAEVIDALDEDLGPHFFPHDPERPEHNPRACPACGDGRLGLKIGRTGGFIGCSNYPECRFTRSLAAAANGGEPGEADFAGPKELGRDPQTSEPVSLRKGPFGFYLQLGEGADGEKPKRISLPKELTPNEVTLAQALALLALPREVGKHPETGNAISAGIGRYGPYIRHGGTYCSLKDDDVLTIGLNRAVSLLAEAKSRGRAPSGKPVGEHPADGKPITLHDGRYGPYVKHGRLNATLPKDIEPDQLTLARAVELLAAQAEKAKSKKAAKPKKATGASGKSKAKTKSTGRKTKATTKSATTKSRATKAKAKSNGTAEPASDSGT
ncbi:MAG: type I DNA topoisomerase [Kiloniellales bacterium]|nr:type I DNA topoisomerase [Kiloniellales bacterium]